MNNREKAKKLFQSMEKIDPALIDEAAEYHPQKKLTLKRWIPIASAAVVLVLALSLTALFSINHGAMAPAPEQKDTIDSAEAVSSYLDRQVVSGYDSIAAQEGAESANASDDIKTDPDTHSSAPVDQANRDAETVMEMDRDGALPQIGEPLLVWLNEEGTRVRLYQISREGSRAIKQLMEDEDGFEPTDDPDQEIGIWIVDEDGAVYAPGLPADDSRQGSKELIFGKATLNQNSPKLLDIVQTYVH